MIHRLTSGFSRLFFSSPPTQSVKQFVEDSIANNKVTIFSKSYCPYCIRVKGLFSDNFPDVKAHVIELDQRQDGGPIQQYLQEKTGQRTVPNVFINNQHIGGNDDTTKIFQSGRLAQLIAE